jgi:hypothetical protein
MPFAESESQNVKLRLLVFFLDIEQITEFSIAESLNAEFIPDSQNYCPILRIKPIFRIGITEFYESQNCANPRIFDRNRGPVGCWPFVASFRK